MMSQNFEELFILQYYYSKPPAKFIDIGAFHATSLSNTRELYARLNWDGILVEPAPKNYAAIAEVYKDEPKIQVLNIAVGDTTGEIDFYESDGDAVSTTEEKHMKIWGGAGVRYSKIKVQQLSVENFFKEYFTPDVKFISSDTESTNIELFRQIPDYVFEQIDGIVIEHDGNSEEIREWLAPFGFSEVYFNAENTLLFKVVQNL